MTSAHFAEIISITYLIEFLFVFQKIHSFTELKCKTKLLHGYTQTLG